MHYKSVFPDCLMLPTGKYNAQSTNIYIYIYIYICNIDTQSCSLTRQTHIHI